MGTASWAPGPLWTPVGLLGTISTYPLRGETADLEVTVRIGDKKIPLDFKISRTPKFSREVPVNLSQTIGGIKVTVDP